MSKIKSNTKARLSRFISVRDFENGYWYATDLKAFAKEIGIKNVSKLRKDQLEQEIKYFLKHKKINPSMPSQVANSNAKKDYEKGLSLNLRVINYSSNKVTKDFIVAEAHKKDPHLPKKSGARYWLNRWRENQLKIGKKITYGDLVKHYVKLCQQTGRLPQIPSARFNNFITNYLADTKGAKKSDAIEAWEKLKNLDIPKTYGAWKKYSR